MKFKTVGDKINFVIALLLGVLILYGVASAIGINRIVGSNVVPGKGISIHTGGAADTAWVLPGQGLAFSDSHLVVLLSSWMSFHGDSVGINTDTFMALSKTDWIDTLDEYFVTMGMLTDTAWMLRDVARDSAVGVWNDSLAVHYADFMAGTDPGVAINDSIKLGWQIWQKIDTSTAKIPGASLADSALAFTWGAIMPWHIDTTARNYVFDDAYRGTSAVDDSQYVTKKYVDLAVGGLSGGAIDDSIIYGWQIYQKMDTTAAKIPTASLADSALAFTWQGIKPYHVDSASANFVFDDAFHVTSAVADSEYSTIGYVKGYATKSIIVDSVWHQDKLRVKEPAIQTGVDDQINIFYPMAEKTGNITHRNFVRSYNSTANADQKDTITYSFDIPGGWTNDVDSVTFGYRTTDTDSGGGSIRIRVYSMLVTSGWGTADTLKAAPASQYSSTAGAWKWYTITGANLGTIGALAYGFIQIECNMDQNDTVDVEEPVLWAKSK